MDFSEMVPTGYILIKKKHIDLIETCQVCLSTSSELQRSAAELRMYAAELRKKSTQLCAESKNIYQRSKVYKQK